MSELRRAMMIERVCPACKGRTFFESWSGALVSCVYCNGSGFVMEPDDETCRRMMERAMKEAE